MRTGRDRSWWEDDRLKTTTKHKRKAKATAMDINDAFPSKWLKATEFEEDMILTMNIVQMEEIGQGEDKETKPVLYFKETDKGLVLNKTNAATITTLYGSQTTKWGGKKIALFPTEVSFGGKQTLAIRVRMKPPKADKGSQPELAPDDPENDNDPFADE